MNVTTGLKNKHLKDHAIHKPGSLFSQTGDTQTQLAKILESMTNEIDWRVTKKKKKSFHSYPWHTL